MVKITELKQNETGNF